MRVHDWFDGIGGYVGIALVLFVFAILGTLVEVQSSDRVLWTGARVVGSEQGGIITYGWDAQQYTLDAAGDTSRAHVVVYLDRSDPNTAQTGSVLERGVDLGFTVIPLALSGLVLAAGVHRRRRADRVRVREVREYGGGLDPEYVQNYLERLRHRDDS